MKKLLFAVFWIGISINRLLFAQTTKQDFSIIPQPVIIQGFLGEFNIITKAKFTIILITRSLNCLAACCPISWKPVIGHKEGKD